MSPSAARQHRRFSHAIGRKLARQASPLVQPLSHDLHPQTLAAASLEEHLRQKEQQRPLLGAAYLQKLQGLPACVALSEIAAVKLDQLYPARLRLL